MSAIYHSKDFSALYNAHFNAVLAWVKANPGGSIEACAAALNTSYEVVYAICTQTEIVIFPTTGGELNWHVHKP